MMTKEEIDALEAVVQYVLETEYSHYLEHLEDGGKPEKHIYTKAMTLDHYVRGLYSTEVIK
jgi:hypothetical protein